MKFIILISTSLFPCFLFGQDLNFEKVNKLDSIGIATTWEALLQSVKLHNKKNFKSLSLDKVVCNRCRFWDNHDPFADIATEAKLPIDSFINEAFTHLATDGLWNTLENHSYLVSVEKVSNNLLYTLSFSFKPQDYPEGYVHYITFLKKGKQFKFYGWNTIP